MAEPTPKAAGRGYVLALGVRFHDCEHPVDVRLVAATPPKFWQGRARSRQTVFRMGFPSSGTSDIQAGLGKDGEEGVIHPLRAPWTKGTSAEFSDLAVDTRSKFYEVSATIGSWHRHLRPVVIAFTATWLKRRSSGTCYLNVPALTGAASVLTAQTLRGKAREAAGSLETGGEVVRAEGLEAPDDRPELEPSVALVSLDTGGSVIDVAHSSPIAIQRPGNEYQWSCAARPPARRRALLSPYQRSVPGQTDVLSTDRPDATAVLSGTRYATLATASDCGAVLALVEPQAESHHDVALVALGVLLGLLPQLLLEALNRWAGRR